MKAKDLRALSPDELQTKIKDLREELFRIKFQHSTQQLENTARFRLLKRDIARVETVICEK
ncbi:MAG: 50S ribosomal protein L29 [Thermodesulfobacteriota bacterium]|nr:50S ribosomal protein L29 [Desulfovibrionales bacterium]MDQ7838863.1 50S ribosomal protein L29 [Thermodesulfobacteriota bacterium]